MSKDIEKKLLNAIRDSKMSRAEISRLSGTSEAALSLFVNGKRTLTLTSAAKIAKTLGLELKKKNKKDKESEV
jgi:transcriptional regulator with XRE-family HTH domain